MPETRPQPALEEPSPSASPNESPNALAGTGYRAVRPIAVGGAGIIYDAVHVALGKHVAVKVLRRGFEDAAHAVERMRVEAQALALLKSPHLVDVSDFGYTPDGRPFYVMELLSGMTLVGALKRRGWLPAAEAIALVRQLLKGLDVAHRAGIVHRDIKLENLFLAETPDGERVLKILDFGIAKVLPGARSIEPSAMQTSEGAIVGTPRFIAPEQVLCTDVDARADLYATGMVLYALLTGRDPFYGIEGIAPLLSAAVLMEPARPSSVARQPIDARLEAVVLRALAKRPEDRFASAEEFAAALARAGEPIASARDGAARDTASRDTATPGPRAGAPVMVACLLVLGSAVLSIVLTLLARR